MERLETLRVRGERGLWGAWWESDTEELVQTVVSCGVKVHRGVPWHGPEGCKKCSEEAIVERCPRFRL